MLERRTVLDRIEIDGSGSIFLRLLKQIVDGDAVYSSEPHRTVIEPTTAVADQVAAVNAHLEQLGFPPISAGDVERAEAFARIARTPEVVKAFLAKQEAERPALASLSEPHE